MAVQEVRVCGVDVTCLHTIPHSKLLRRVEGHKVSRTYATMSETSFCVGTMDSLKKLMTTELNLSRSSGYRLKDDCSENDQAAILEGNLLIWRMCQLDLPS